MTYILHSTNPLPDCSSLLNAPLVHAIVAEGMGQNGSNWLEIFASWLYKPGQLTTLIIIPCVGQLAGTHFLSPPPLLLLLRNGLHRGSIPFKHRLVRTIECMS